MHNAQNKHSLKRLVWSLSGSIGLPDPVNKDDGDDTAISRVPLGDLKLSQSDTGRRWMFQQLRLRAP